MIIDSHSISKSIYLPGFLMKIKIYKILMIYIFHILIIIPVYAGENDNSAVNLLEDQLTVRFSLQIPVFLVCIKPGLKSGETSDEENSREDAHITYMPDLRLSGGAGLYYKGFGFSYITRITDIPTTSDHSITEYTDIRLSEYYRKFGADLIYMNYTGFYLMDSNEHGYSGSDPEAKRTDMNLRTISASAFYLFSDDFSLRASFMQNEKQNEWDWTIIAFISAIYQSLDSDYSLIPQENEAAFSDNAGLESGVFKGIAAGPGFGITIPYKDYLFSAVSCFGSGFMHRKYETYDGTKTEHDGFYRINVKSSIGYNGTGYFYGLSFVFDSIANYSGIRILANTYTTELYSGLHF